MITDDTVKEIFEIGRPYLQKFWQDDLFSEANTPSQFWKGNYSKQVENANPNYCEQYSAIFRIFNIIPRACFKCYKIQINSENVVDLLKLMVLFNTPFLPNDNPRKCMVESRPFVKGAYKALIYSLDLQEAERILITTKKVLEEKISKNFQVSLKRGCTEMSLAYPGFEQVDSNDIYKEEWKYIEDFAETTYLGVRYDPFKSDLNNNYQWMWQDAEIMLTWLKYASTIGDLSYLRISKTPLPKFRNIKRPSHQPIDPK